MAYDIIYKYQLAFYVHIVILLFFLSLAAGHMGKSMLDMVELDSNTKIPSLL